MLMARARRTLAMVGVPVIAGALLAACGDDAGGGKELALVPGVQNEPFYITMECGAKAEAESRGYTLQTNAPAKFEATLQEPIVTGLGAKKPAALLIAPTDDVAMAGPIQQVKDQGVKIIEVDTALKDTGVALTTITSNNEKGGALAAETLNKLTSGKSGTVLVLDTKAGTSTTNARAKGFEDELKKYPNLKMSGVEFTDNEPDQAGAKVTAKLASTPDLIGIFATNLNTGEGAATGLRTAGKIGAVNLIGFDASPSEVEGLQKGEFQALIAQDPATIGKEGVKQAIDAIDGKQIQRNIEAPLVALTKDNMAANEKYFYKSKC
jgi:ribose transport system substrate-binding protein